MAPALRYHDVVMPREERIFYSDANGIRIGELNAVFGPNKYSTRNIQSALLARERVVRWPGYLVMLIGMAIMAYGMLTSFAWTLVGFAGVMSGTINLARKKDNYAIRLVTNKGPVLVLASRDKAYIQTVVDSIHRALAALEQRTAIQETTSSVGSHSKPD
jgi:hypothetical protein